MADEKNELPEAPETGAVSESEPPEGGVMPVASVTFSPTRWTQFTFIAGAFIAFWLLSHIIRGAWGYFAEPETAPAEPIAAVIAIVGALFAYRRGPARSFVDECAQELAQVTWPDRPETWRSTYVVIVLSVVAGVGLFLIDTVWGSLSDLIYGA